MKTRVNVFDHIGHLVVKSVFKSGKVAVVTSSDPSIDLSHVVYLFMSDYTFSKFHSTVKIENGKFVTIRKTMSIFQV